MSRTIRLINDENYEIEFTDESIANHFNEPKNCTKEILIQTNDVKIYDGVIEEDDKVILDLGANIGLFAIHATPYADKIYCLEPTPSHFQILTKLTSKFDNIERIEGALADETGTIDFFEFSGNSTMNTLFRREPDSNPITVNSYSLPDLIEKLNLDKVDFCKIDIEGSEIIALNDSIIEAVSNKVKKFFIEFHWYAGVSFARYCEIYKEVFERHGYTVKGFETYQKFGPDTLYCYKEL